MRVKFKKSVRLQGATANPGDVMDITAKDASYLLAVKACEPCGEEAKPAADIAAAIEEAVDPIPEAPKKRGRPPKNRAADVEETRGE